MCDVLPCFQYGFKQTGGVEHVPSGWDDWNGLVRVQYMCNVSAVIEKVRQFFANNSVIITSTTMKLDQNLELLAP